MQQLATESRALLKLLVCCLTCIPASGDEHTSRELVGRLKSATAVVVQSGGLRGTACCIHPQGWFVTATSSLSMDKTIADLQLIVNPGTDGERPVRTRVIRADESSGLTLLRAEAGNYVALPPGDDEDLFETNLVHAVGYPFQTGAVSAERIPEVEVHTTRIKSLKKPAGKLLSFGLERQLAVSTAGGPVTDSAGRLVGILASGSRREGIETVIAISKIRESLLQPVIEFNLQSIRSTELADECEIPVRVTMFREAGELDVRVEFESDGSAVRLAPVQGTVGQFSTRMVLPASQVMPRLQLEAHFGDTVVVAYWKDPTLTIGEESVPICQIRRFEFSPQTGEVVIMTNSRVVMGKVSGFAPASLQLGDVLTEVDLLKADNVFGSLLPAETAEITYRVTVRESGAPISEVTGGIRVETVEAITIEREPRPKIDFPAPVLHEPETIVRLPAPIDDVVAGAGGRFLLLHLKKLRQLAVFDVSLTKVVKYIPLTSNNITCAAGAAKLFIGRRDDQRIQRWDLLALEPELTVDAPVGGVRTLAMGATSFEPVFLLSEIEAKTSFLLNPISLKAETIHWEGWRGGAWGPAHINVSYDGGTVVASGGGWAGMELAAIRDGKLESQHTGGRSLEEPLIAGNGMLVFPAGGATIREDLTSKVPEFEGTVFPALDDQLSLSWVIRDGNAFLNVFTNTDARRICTIRHLPELTEKTHLPIHKRVFLIPKASVLITTGKENDHLILRPFDLQATLQADDVDYLFVRSEPGRTVTRGDHYSYTIAVMSRKGNVAMQLESGPPGMTLSDDGVLSWHVPVDSEPGDVTVIIKVQDASGQEVFHSFRIRVR